MNRNALGNYLLVFFSIFTAFSNAQTRNGCNLSDDWILLEPKEQSNDLSLKIDYKKCYLDLSPYTYLTIDVLNESSEDIIVDLEYMGPKKKLNQGRFFIPANAKETKKLTLNRPALKDTSPWSKDFSSIRGYPGNYVKHWNGFNLKEVRMVSLSAWSNNGADISSRVKIKAPYGSDALAFFSQNYQNIEFPIIDEFGQYNKEDWKYKVHSEKELKEQGKRTVNKYADAKFSDDFTVYGGFKKGKKYKSTGFFYTKKVAGKWWFVDPDGYLFWSLGVTGAGVGSKTYVKGLKYAFADLEVDADFEKSAQLLQQKNRNYYEYNLFRKYGKPWKEIHSAITAKRLKSWGMNSYGAWSQKPTLVKHPYTLIVHPAKQGMGAIEKVIDPFSPEFKRDLKSRLRSLAKHKDDPFLLGVFVNNELHWNNPLSIPVQVMAEKNSKAAKKELISFLKNKYSSIEALNTAWNSTFTSFDTLSEKGWTSFAKNFKDDMYKFLFHYASTYYKTVNEALNKVLPNHLYFGSRIHGKVKSNRAVIEAASLYCDVVSYNVYEFGVKDFQFLFKEDKPAIIGEFHFGTATHGVWGTGLRNAYDLNNQAKNYNQYIKEALNKPNIVGAHWFQWSDQPTTGRGSDGENFRIGIVNIVDNEYEEFVNQIKKTSSTMYQERLNSIK